MTRPTRGAQAAFPPESFVFEDIDGGVVEAVEIDGGHDGYWLVHWTSYYAGDHAYVLGCWLSSERLKPLTPAAREMLAIAKGRR